VGELDAVSREFLARLWAAGVGPADPTGPLTFDLDSTIVRVYGRGKQGADYGYTKVRGYHPQLATLAETGQVIFSRMRGGKASAAGKAKSFLTETVSRLRHAGATGQLTFRADSAFYSRAVISTARAHRVRFSITARQNRKIRAVIQAIPEHAWRPIPYWLSTAEVSGADVTETSYTAFAGTKDATEARLIVRRVRPTPGAHAPSGRFFANAAWTSLAVMAHNLARAVGALAGAELVVRATVTTLRRKLFAVPGRLVRSARRLRLRLPRSWPWQTAFLTALDAITALPMRC
jgi:hypothetical protein